jgi:hypothetical protein
MTNHVHSLREKSTVFLVAAAFLLNGCYSYRVATLAQKGTEVNSIVAHSFFWGLVKKPKAIQTPLCDSLQVNGMSEVTAKTNLGYALITVATLGIWAPMKLEWYCGKPASTIKPLNP